MSTTAVAVEGALEEAPQHSQLTASHMVGTRLVLALVKKLCEDAPERAIRRGLVLGAVLHTLEHAQQSDIGLLSSMTKVHALLAKFSRSKSMSQRLFSVEVCVSLIQKSRGGRRPGTLFATIMARTEDKVPKVRARALQGIASVLAHSTPSSPLESARTGGEGPQTPRATVLRLAIQRQFVNDQGQLSARLSKRLDDASSTVRKQACRLLSEASMTLLGAAAARLDAAAAAGISAVIQPGGSMRDQEVIEAADEHGIAMVFTGIRHFRH